MILVPKTDRNHEATRLSIRAPGSAGGCDDGVVASRARDGGHRINQLEKCADTKGMGTFLERNVVRSLPAVGEPGLIEAALDTAQELLGMEMAYLADTRTGLQDYRALTGNAESFGARIDEPVSLSGTYCGLLVAGELDGLVPDARIDPRVAGLEITHRAGIGAYVGVPVHLPDGELFGTLCCLSHNPDPSLRERDLRFMRVLARHVMALLVALQERDGYTEQHSQEVVSLALAVARELGVPPEAMEDVRHAALLHDVGKIGISDTVLNKPGKLTFEEWEAMRQHPVIGERMVRSMPGLSHLAPVIRAEHERWDGTGYPDGRAALEIPLISRIVLVCDAYHAMTSDRPYRRAMSVQEARDELEAGSGAHFCPSTVAAALRVLARHRP
jgi:putative nucleotidyltransferase with HDIG domain